MKALKAKLSDEGVLDKQLDAELVKLHGRGNFMLACNYDCPVISYMRLG